ncbi:Protein of unknown function (DUF3558) [Streptoalloteichus tenebrarius]|uniref:Uncharacterized protein n=1 Tax=Streptoalloteichus tenebrarius (strain ATCC 17920 / DSM 40477 / JCM 4838 / CBS 697.72 / NBRC 16177 / NCIMB 11028 / NRRL B-12390 / A12253. 1 / ISP 5477) TaxID=1933 RepID=A0ABT1HYA6_STRSD|nr:Protein of unknown function (DUF3558) [Streptoalloteichus tenebrarius]
MPKALDTAKFQQDPCSVLTAAELQTLRVAAKGEVDKDPAPRCAWSDWRGPSKLDFSVTIAANRQGLAQLYRNKGNFEHFEPFQVEGYPAVMLDDSRVGMCDVEVAVMDSLSNSVKVQFTDDDKAAAVVKCGQTKILATEVMKTLKGGG